MSHRWLIALGSSGSSGSGRRATINALVLPGLTTGTTGGRALVSAGVLLALLAVGVGIRRAGPRLRRRVDPLLAAGIQTLTLLALAGAATLALVVTWNAAGVSTALSAGPRIGIRVTVTLVLFIAAALTARFLTRAIDRVGTDRWEAVHGREVASYLARAGAFAVAGLLTFSIWGIDLGNLLLGAGLFGAVIGLAARQTIGSVIWGFVILAARPFTVGDWVVIGEREGQVSDIRATSTELIAETGERIVIANHRIADLDVENRSVAGRRRVDGEITVERDTDIDRAVEVIESTLGDVAGTTDTPEPTATVTTVGEEGITVRLSVWTRDPTPERAANVRSEAIVAVVDALGWTGGSKTNEDENERDGSTESKSDDPRSGKGETHR